MSGALVAMLALIVGASGLQPASATRVQDPRRPSTTFDTAYGCVACHADKRRAFILGTHSERGIRCHDCHGGDPSSFEQATAHRPSFVGSPGKVGIAQLCASCHSDPAQMRQYALPVDQFAEFRTSQHGRLLLEQNDTDAPTCTDCHDAHTILPREDARSRIYPTNISATCGKCHENSELMAERGLLTDQVERYRQGAHGVSLFDEQNFASPTCVGCHGSHAALPPLVSEVAHVCDRCHVLLRSAFYQGPHGPPALSGDIPGCLACHSNHGTEQIAPDQIASLCQTCHGADSRASVVGIEIQERVIRSTDELRTAEHSIEEMVRAGRDVSDVRFRYKTALTYYAQIAQVQHSLDLERLEDLGLRVGSIARDIRAAAEVSAEARWEHKLLLVPVWFLALATMVLSWFKLRDLKQGGS